jgi:DNA-binding NarL/FixJ family response regulator
MIRVLVVDDSDCLRAAIGHFLRGTDGVECVADAADGAAGVDAALRHEPDVVVMDLSMPVMDGVEATRRIRSVLPNTGVVVLTAFAGGGDAAAADAAGAASVLSKEVAPAMLVEAIREAAPVRVSSSSGPACAEGGTTAR